MGDAAISLSSLWMIALASSIPSFPVISFISPVLNTCTQELLLQPFCQSVAAVSPAPSAPLTHSIDALIGRFVIPIMFISFLSQPP